MLLETLISFNQFETCLNYLSQSIQTAFGSQGPLDKAPTSENLFQLERRPESCFPGLGKGLSGMYSLLDPSTQRVLHAPAAGCGLLAMPRGSDMTACIHTYV